MDNRKNLINWLAQLNSAETSWALYVNPETYEFRTGQVIFENGGLLDECKYVATLDYLTRMKLDYAQFDPDDFLCDIYRTVEEAEEAYYENDYADCCQEWAEYFVDTDLMEIIEENENNP